MGTKARILPDRPPFDARIGFVCFSRSFGGLEMTTVRLAALLAARGAYVHLIVPAGSPMQKECSSLNIPWTSIEPAFKYGDLRAAVHLARTFRRHHLDIAMFLRSHDLHLGALASLLAPDTRLAFYQQMQSGIEKKDVFHTAVFSRFAAWLTLTDIMRQEVLTWTTMPGSRVHVAYLGRDTSSFQPSQRKRHDSRAALDLPRNAFIAGVLGRLDRQKGQMEFLESVPAVLKRIPDALFLIAGDETKNDPGMRQHLSDRIRDLNIEANVRLLPPTDDVPDFLAALDVFVMPSYSETYGLVLIEAMAMQLPVITTNSGGVPELVRDRKEGILVEPKNVRQLSDALTTLGVSAVTRRQYGTSGRKRFDQLFREEVCIDNLIHILSLVLRPRT